MYRECGVGLHIQTEFHKLSYTTDVGLIKISGLSTENKKSPILLTGVGMAKFINMLAT